MTSADVWRDRRDQTPDFTAFMYLGELIEFTACGAYRAKPSTSALYTTSWDTANLTLKVSALRA